MQWRTAVAAAVDPVNAPASDPPRWERFWNASYSVAGVFIDDMDLRAATYPPTDQGGFQSNPDTRYLLTPVSRKYGRLITVSGKMPTFPKTLPASTRWSPRDYQVRYWSMCSGSSPVTGLGYDCVYDQQVPLGKGRRVMDSYVIRSSFIRLVLRIAVFSVSFRNVALSTRSTVTGQLNGTSVP